MTTIILVVIGIVLAGASALMVVFYGGDAFSSGDVAANAATMMNAGQNVLAANTMYRLGAGRDSTGVDDLVANHQMTQNPSFGDVGTGMDAWVVVPVAGATSKALAYVVTGIDPRICDRIARHTESSAKPGAYATGTMGCYLPEGQTALAFYTIIRRAAAL